MLPTCRVRSARLMNVSQGLLVTPLSQEALQIGADSSTQMLGQLRLRVGLGLIAPVPKKLQQLSQYRKTVSALKERHLTRIFCVH